MATIFLKTGRFPSEVRALPQGERSFLYAALMVEQEENQKG